MSDMTLMQSLMYAGYPLEYMDHHHSDLYVYVTPSTTRIVEEWCKEHGFCREWGCPTFKDQITGKLMYDCAFAYDPYWRSVEDQSIKAMEGEIRRLIGYGQY